MPHFTDRRPEYPPEWDKTDPPEEEYPWRDEWILAVENNETLMSYAQWTKEWEARLEYEKWLKTQPEKKT
jgi:hypothetical protein